MAKIVCYNGGTESYYGCTAHKDFVCGNKYEVVFENDRGCQTDYTLKGVNGYFNACWFDEVPFEKNFIVFAHTVPMLGNRDITATRLISLTDSLS